jgi:hypothetical protein
MLSAAICKVREWTVLAKSGRYLDAAALVPSDCWLASCCARRATRVLATGSCALRGHSTSAHICQASPGHTNSASPVPVPVPGVRAHMAAYHSCFQASLPVPLGAKSTTPITATSHIHPPSIRHRRHVKKQTITAAGTRSRSLPLVRVAGSCHAPLLAAYEISIFSHRPITNCQSAASSSKMPAICSPPSALIGTSNSRNVRNELSALPCTSSFSGPSYAAWSSLQGEAIKLQIVRRPDVSARRYMTLSQPLRPTSVV